MNGSHLARLAQACLDLERNTDLDPSLLWRQNPGTGYKPGYKVFWSSWYQRPEVWGSYMVDDSDYGPVAIPREPDTVDTYVSIHGTGASWDAHKEVLCEFSSFFKCWLQGPFEPNCAPYKLKFSAWPIDPKTMNFIFGWLYGGWTGAIITAPSRVGLPLERIAKAIVAADYLQMPLLCYEARYHVVRALAEISRHVDDDAQFCHNLVVKQKPFICAAKILRDSGTGVGKELSQKIFGFFKSIKGKHFEWQVNAAFLTIFPREDHWILQTEYQY